MHIHLVHPKFLSDELLQHEHDFVHKLFDSLSEGDKESLEHPDAFRYNGRRGQLYVRHRKIVEEMIIRGMTHDTLIDRRDIKTEEWAEPDLSPEDVLAEVEKLRAAASGRVPLPKTTDPADYTCLDDISSVFVGSVEHDILRGLWKIYRHVVMERSYGRYRSLLDPLQGRGRGSVWMLFDLMMEEALAQMPEDRAPGIAYETIWETLEEKATDEEKAGYERLTGDLEPGKIGLEMRRFLAGVAKRQDNKDLMLSALLSPYM
jgi:hypothetical protein